MIQDSEGVAGPSGNQRTGKLEGAWRKEKAEL